MAQRQLQGNLDQYLLDMRSRDYILAEESAMKFVTNIINTLKSYRNMVVARYLGVDLAPSAGLTCGNSITKYKPGQWMGLDIPTSPVFHDDFFLKSKRRKFDGK